MGVSRFVAKKLANQFDEGLDMSTSARMGRAKSAGYDMNDPIHAGTDLEPAKTIYGIDEFYPGGNNYFGGIFGHTSKEVAESHGKNIQEIYVKNRIDHDDFRSLTLFDSDGDEESSKQLKKAISEIYDNELNDDDVNLIKDYIVDGGDVPDIFEDLVGAMDPGEIDWAAQGLKGELAKRMGFDAVGMPDEHGESWLVLKGRYKGAAFDPNRLNSKNLMAGSAPLALTGAASLSATDASASDLNQDQIQAIENARSRMQENNAGFSDQQMQIIEQARQRKNNNQDPQSKTLSNDALERIESARKKASAIPFMAGPNMPASSMKQSKKIAGDAAAKRQENLEKLRLVNPFLAEEIENMSDFDAVLIGAGGSVQNLIDGLDRVFGDATAEDVKKPHFDTLKSIKSSAELGEALGELSALAVPGGAVAGLTKTAGKAAIMTGAGLAATESGLMSAGRGDSPEEIAINTAVGGVVGGATPLVTKSIGNTARRLVSKSDTVNDYLEDVATQQADNFIPKSDAQFLEGAKKATIRKGINEGTIDGVGWKFNESGKVVKDQLQRDLVKKGVDERFIGAKNTMSDADKKAANEMVDLAENFIRGVKGSETKRPQMVIGKNAMQRFDVIKKAQRDASSRIGQAVDKDIRGNPVNLTNELDEFVDDLEALGIQVDGDKLNFQESLIQGSNTTPVKHVFRMVKDFYDDAADAHRLKQAITNQINYDTPVLKPIDREAENALKSLRSKINEKLRSMSPDYAAANDDFAKAARAIQPFAENMGRRFDPESTRVDNFVGQELRKTITNYAKANDLIEDIANLETIATEFGGKFDDDIMTQIMLNSELERMFGSFAPGSMQGVIEKGGQVAMERALGPVSRVADAGIEKVKDRLLFSPPSKEKLTLINQLRDLIAQ